MVIEIIKNVEVSIEKKKSKRQEEDFCVVLDESHECSVTIDLFLF